MHPWIPAFIALAATSTAAAAAPIVRFETSGPAQLTVTGNTLGLAGDPGGPSTNDGIGVFIDAELGLQAPGWPLGTTSDWSLASSDATLDLPAGATILHAELVWGGTVGPDVLADIDGAVRLRTPSGAVHLVAPDPVTGRAIDGPGAPVVYYGRSADVTALVEGGGSYRVGAVASTLDDADAAAGWSLYVVYRHDPAALRRIALMTVMALVAPSTEDAEVTAEISGLCVHDAAAERSARIALTAIDGDANIAGDTLRFARQPGQLNGNGARVNAIGATQDNLYGGRITRDDGTIDLRGSFGAANHGAASNVAGARQGWDVLTVQASAFLGTDWDSAWFRAGADDDQHGLLAIALSIDLRTPYLAGPALSASPSGGAPSGVVAFTMTLTNVGDVAAGEARFALPGELPQGIEYVAGSFAIDGAAPAAGAVGAASALLTGVALGEIAAGQTVVVSLQLRFAAPSVAAWSFAPRVTYANAACAGARTDPFAPAPIVFRFGEVRCGDGKKEADELCDDGDATGGDGCSAVCTIEPTWACGDNPASEGSPAMPDSICSAGCGDGVFVAGAEQCDDGDRSGGDGCDAACAIEPGWVCDARDGASSCSEVCGDGRIVGRELCDDGVPQGALADGCGASCGSIDHGWACLGEPSNCRARCGDGLIAVDVEACDDGDREGGDGCAADCSIELGWSCEREPSRCATACGDGTLRDGEQCDDGGNEDGDGCSASCRFEPGWVCAQDDGDEATRCRFDGDQDGVIDDGDESGDPLDNPCPEGGPVLMCDDNCPSFANPDQTFPVPGNLFCPVYDGPRTRGGGGCSGGAEGALASLFLAVFLRVRRARAHALALLVCVGVLTGAPTRAQQVDPHNFEPTLSPLGVLGVETSATSAHLRPWVNLVATLADDELSTQTGPGALASGPIDYRFMLLFGAGIGLFDQLDLALGLPLVISETSKFGELSQSDMGMADLRVLVRGRVLGPATGGEGFGLALALHMTFPTGSDTPFLSDGEMTAKPQLVLDYRTAGGFLAALNVGFRFRPERSAGDLVIGDELRMGFGAEIPIGFHGFAFTGEIAAALSLADSPFDGGGIAAREVPVEVLGGMRWRSDGGVTVSGAVGGGLTEGYGAPDFRLLFGLAFNVPAPERYEEPIVPASRNEWRDDWNVRQPIDGKQALEVGAETFDRIAREDPDADTDGVTGPADLCPTIAEDRDGFQDDDGCPDPDDDNDGVFDAADKCPNEAESLNGIDDFDGCYDEPRPIAGTGIKDNRIELNGRIEFKARTAELLPSDLPVLDQVALVMRANPAIERIRIEVHSDNLGDRELGVDLCERRAAAVRAYLVTKGIDEQRLFPKGFGSLRPVANNRTAAGRKLNQRVELHVVRDGEPLEGDLP